MQITKVIRPEQEVEKGDNLVLLTNRFEVVNVNFPLNPLLLHELFFNQASNGASHLKQIECKLFFMTIK